MVEELIRHNRLAVDTESNSLHSYRDRVCLIQFSASRHDYLVDPLALTDLSPLETIFSNQGIEKIFHAADYDTYGLYRDFGFTIENLFDTMIAARTLGYTSLGLGSLLAEKFGLDLDKRHQKADWARRPLPPEQIDYARLDTHYLFQLRDALYVELQERGRWELAREDFVRCCHTNIHNGDRRERWERINGHQELSPRQQTILHELCLARERMAEKLDRPVFKVAGDHLLLETARLAPSTFDGLVEIGFTEKQLHRVGRSLLEAIQRGESAPLVQRTETERPPEAVLNRLQRLKLWRKNTAQALEVESDVILPRSVMQAIAEQNPRNWHDLAGIMADLPWRFDQYGRGILSALGVLETAQS